MRRSAPIFLAFWSWDSEMWLGHWWAWLRKNLYLATQWPFSDLRWLYYVWNFVGTHGHLPGSER